MKSKEYGLIQLMQNQKDDYRNKNKELSKLKLKLAFDFPVGMEEQLSEHTKTMLNKQLRSLDGLERLSEGKSLQVKDCVEEEDGVKNYTLHSWLSSMRNVNYSTKKVRIQVVTPSLWKSIISQSKVLYLYKEKRNTSKQLSGKVFVLELT